MAYYLTKIRYSLLFEGNKMAWVIPKDFNFKDPRWLKVFGVILIIDSFWSLIHPSLAHTYLFDLGRLIRAGIGLYLLTYSFK